MTVFQLPASIQTKVIKSAGVTIYYPGIFGLADLRVQNQINHIIYNTVLSMRQEQLKHQTGTLMEMLGHYEIKTNERGLLSLTFSNYAYSYPMAHGFTIVKSLSINTNTGQVYSLPELFKPGSDYITVLSELVSAQIKQRDIPLLNGFQSIRPNQDYYLADKSLVLYFQLYEITPYYVGFPMFPISVYTVQSIASEQGPLPILSADIA